MLAKQPQTTLTFRVEIAHQLASQGTVEGSQRLQLQRFQHFYRNAKKACKNACCNGVRKLLVIV